MVSWPETLNAYRFFLRDRIDEGRGDRVAIRHRDDLLTFREVDAMASGYARLLRDRGVGKGDRVLVVLPDGPQFAAAIFGILRIGGVVVMLNPGLTADDLGGIVDRSRAAGAIVHSRHLSHYRSSLRAWEPDLIECSPGM
ncbi:MAG: AMP-binding protein, partial [Actinobacteria bacterium]|nr:AMP-binding protein [Actinomycetota bacterium]